MVANETSKSKPWLDDGCEDDLNSKSGPLKSKGGHDAGKRRKSGRHKSRVPYERFELQLGDDVRKKIEEDVKKRIKDI